MDQKNELALRLRQENAKVADACRAFLNAFEKMDELQELGDKHGGMVNKDDLPEHFYLEVVAYGPEQALQNYREALDITRRQVHDAIEGCEKVEIQVMEEWDEQTR